MSDVECPYCGADCEISHDDGYGYEEDQTYSQECPICEQYFAYTTLISFTYNAKRADCLNGGRHVYKPTNTWPVRYTKMQCTECGDYRPCTESEINDVIEQRKEKKE